MPNGCLQQIAANRFSTPQDVIAILLQGFVRHVLVSDHWWMTASDDTAAMPGRYRESAPTPGYVPAGLMTLPQPSYSTSNILLTHAIRPDTEQITCCVIGISIST